MTQKIRLNWISEVRLEDTITATELIYAIAPAFAAIATYFIGEELHFKVEAGLVGGVLIINLCILLVKSMKAKETEELSPLYSFIFNRLLPNRSGDEQTYDVKIAVIDDNKHSDFREALKRKFKKEFDAARLKQFLLGQAQLKAPKLDALTVEVKDQHLFFAAVESGPSSSSDKKQLLRLSKKNLEKNLEHKTAVVLVRTEATDQRPWLYQALSDWGNSNSEIPVLFVKDRKKSFTDDPNAKKFLWMPNDPKSLPWRLLERSLTRAKAWRFQATFNRVLFWNGIYVLLLIFYIASIQAKNTEHGYAQREGNLNGVVQSQQSDLNRREEQRLEVNKIVGSAMDRALDTERALRPFLTKPLDKDFAVSYWYRLKGQPYILITTEVPGITQFLENDYSTIIGCTFRETNRLVEGRVKGGPNDQMQTQAYDNYNKKVDLREKCLVRKLASVPIKNIACVSRDDGSLDGVRTVGLCAFTQDEKNMIFNKDTSRLLWEYVKNFHTDFASRIQNRREFSLAEREPNDRAAPSQ